MKQIFSVIVWCIAVVAAPSHMEGAGIPDVQTAQQLHELAKGKGLPLLVEFYSPWCHPCRSLDNKREEWARMLQGRMQLCRVNITVARSLMRAYNITSTPTLLHLNLRCREIQRKVGNVDIVQYIESL